MSAVGDALLELDDILRAHDVRDAIGGALTLAYYAEPRATGDVDICVSTPLSAKGDLVVVLAESGWHPETDDALPLDGTRFRREAEPIFFDIFFSFDPYPRSCWPMLCTIHS